MTTLVGTRGLFRLALRRDRLMLPIWIVATVGILVSSYSAIETLYPDAAERLGLVRLIAVNPTLRTLTGQLYDGTTIGGITAWRSLGWAAVALSLMSIFVVTRHTRAEEDTGRLELVGSAAVGRSSPLVAALAVAVSADLVAGVLVGAGLAAQGAALGSCFVFGAAVALPAAVLAALAGVTAQLGASARTANGSAAAVLGVAVLLRAVADGSASGGLAWLSWLSPIGWGQQARPFAGDRLWPLGLAAVVAALLAAVAVRLNGRRDLGAALLPSRPGRATAGAGLRGGLTLAWRLQRGILVGWAVGFLVLGVALGALAPGIGELASSSPQISQILTEIGGVSGLTDAYLSSMLGLVALIAAGYGVSAVARLRAEETGGRAEPVLGTAVSRIRWMGGHVLVAVGGASALLLMAAAAVGGSYDAAGSEADSAVGPLVLAAAGQLPAVWVTVAMVVVLYGVVPRLVAAAWGVYGLFVLLDLFGPTLRLPSAVVDLSPFTHVAAYPLDRITLGPVVILVIVAVAGSAVGFAAFRRRDVGAG